MDKNDIKCKLTSTLKFRFECSEKMYDVKGQLLEDVLKKSLDAVDAAYDAGHSSRDEDVSKLITLLQDTGVLQSAIKRLDAEIVKEKYAKQEAIKWYEEACKRHNKDKCTMRQIGCTDVYMCDHEMGGRFVSKAAFDKIYNDLKELKAKKCNCGTGQR